MGTIATLPRTLSTLDLGHADGVAMSLDDSDYNNMPGTPPDLSSSRSSKTSSFVSSYHSDADSFVADTANFEDIGLDDDARPEARIEVKKSSNPYTFATDLRVPPRRSNAPLNRPQRELTALRSTPKPPFPSLRGQIRNAGVEGLGIVPYHGKLQRGVTSPVTSTFASLHKSRERSNSPSISPRHALSTTLTLKPRRESTQGTRERKSTKELEKECDEEDGDDVPDDCMLENVPMSPRPVEERSRPSSTATSPDRGPVPPKERVRSIGNGTAHIPAEQGELRSPRSAVHRGVSMGQFPINHNNFKPRAKSWTDALSELSEEAKALTEALEAHADESPAVHYAEKGRIKSAFAELPPLRRTEIMIDPLPCSKEKEAVLSRTRPSWLPPKDPAEEKRHLKEYQKMMAMSAEADKRREVEQNIKSACRDDTANSLLRIWEEHVLPNWDEATRQRRTRELWWRGIAPRSRNVIWTKAIGNELGLSEMSYIAASRRAQALEKTIKHGSQLDPEEERKKGWLDQIAVDAQTTYPELRIFQPGGPLHESLLDVLKAYAMYRSDVGYVSGTNVSQLEVSRGSLLILSDHCCTFATKSSIATCSIPCTCQFAESLSAIILPHPGFGSHFQDIYSDHVVLGHQIPSTARSPHLSLTSYSPRRLPALLLHQLIYSQPRSRLCDATLGHHGV